MAHTPNKTNGSGFHVEAARKMSGETTPPIREAADDMPIPADLCMTKQDQYCQHTTQFLKSSICSHSYSYIQDLYSMAIH